MSRLQVCLSAAAAVAIAGQAFAGGVLCSMARLETESEVEKFASELRARGPEGLATALDYMGKLDEQLASMDGKAAKSKRPSAEVLANRRQGEAARATMRRVIDLVAGQRDASISRLYWYTEIDQAKAAAAESDKPILSLRLLGKLTDEYSCANSRFFRTALYSNKEISAYLRQNYVLHWQSVRPVPRVTVDFGDGRKLERTVTGNSAHYVLDAAGRPLEALPGLYTPQAFAEWLVRSKELADRLMPISSNNGRATLLVEHHATRRNTIDEALRADLASFAPQLLKDGTAVEGVARTEQPAEVTAREAGFRAVAKGRAEAPLLAPFLPGSDTLLAQDNQLWQRIAEARRDESKLDESSVTLIRQEHATAAEAGSRSEAKRVQEDPLAGLLRSFEEAMALDTVKNEYLLHRQIHEWFVNFDVPTDVDAFNEKVYAELFLTPSSDPWLGLAPADAYTALEDGGLSSVD